MERLSRGYGEVPVPTFTVRQSTETMSTFAEIRLQMHDLTEFLAAGSCIRELTHDEAEALKEVATTGAIIRMSPLRDREANTHLELETTLSQADLDVSTIADDPDEHLGTFLLRRVATQVRALRRDLVDLERRTPGNGPS